jgi:hypothetical protein
MPFDAFLPHAVLNAMAQSYALLGMLALMPLMEAIDALISFA